MEGSSAIYLEGHLCEAVMCHVCGGGIGSCTMCVTVMYTVCGSHVNCV